MSKTSTLKDKKPLLHQGGQYFLDATQITYYILFLKYVVTKGSCYCRRYKTS